MDEKNKTIVGGRSRGNRLLGEFPRSIEILLKKAKVDEAFHEYLLQDPFSAAESIELKLSQQEINILHSIPRTLLEKTIDSTSIMKQNVNAFRTAKKAAVLILLLGTTAVVPVVAGTGQEEVVGYSEEQYSLARERMKAVQYALEAYKAKHGTYPTTIEWQEQVNPLDGFALNSDLFDPWHRKFHYEDYKEGGQVVNYHLESNGLDIDSPIDNVPCPVAANEHLFPEESPIKMIYPRWDQDVVLLSDEAEAGAINEFLAEHKNPRVFINWYLDDQKIGQTIENNTLVVELQPGEHTLLLVDENGYSSSVDFTVKRGTNE